jgi:predicted nucleic acid-binding protein
MRLPKEWRDMPPRFRDTNLLLRYFTRDDEAKARRALALLRRVEQGDETVDTSLLVVFETVYTLQSFYKVPRPLIWDLLSNVVQLRGVRLPGKQWCIQALDLYASQNISFADAYHVVSMRAQGIAAIYSWDTDFDKFEGIRRIEPEE